MSNHHHVAVLAYEGMSAFELGIVTEIFGVPWLPTTRYRLTVCTEDDSDVQVLGGATLRTPHTLETLRSADTVIIPSVTNPEADASGAVISALRAAYDKGARMVSICSGAFALASAGLLDGRQATTHWLHTDLLARRFPLVEVDPDPLYIDSGRILTSAGSAAGLDLCLHLVRQDHGAEVANLMARRLVVAPHRAGGQAQYIEAPVNPDPEDDRVAASMNWALRSLDRTITVAMMAEQARMSPRSYLRHFARATGTSPFKWVIHQRIQASLPLLETTTSSVEHIARSVGFDTAVTYRHHFARAMRTSPSAYRRTFRSGLDQRP
ncbi:helix-turn-helix domain-containing protein [Natronoglycomyces albus]|uniref:Helix-turn-helix domain-containing protein n=1 Tax=Natronoglycomyces albus TaxID=2811108 RepID=A0A895XPT2_9ACTN|nr:helix-turn-helix domain-containing protein [Natronoglycomyces albus]QSB05379.1 helix-turn-helix domain-containing protein [Natronoglycomyces albus]